MTRSARPSDPSRAVAYDAIHAVTTRDAYANLVLPAAIGRRGLQGRDAAFATELTYGTLRGLGTYDLVLAACLDRPLDTVDRDLLDVLRLGVHQLLGSRVPDHAAVSATVDLAHDVLGARRSGLVNAVLRRVARDDRGSWLERLAPAADVDLIGHLSVMHAHPRWIVVAFMESLGGDVAQTQAALAADNAPPRVTLVARPGASTREELVAAGGTATPWSPFGVTWPAGAPGDVPAVAEGRAGVQDEGSQLVALASATTPLVGADRRWLDLCAGPGGKAALLTALAAQRDAHVLAVERQPHRAGLVAAATAPWRGASGQVVVADATVAAWRDGSFDRVVADVPCSGLGALRRRPEARWRRSPEDVATLAALQRRLLHAAVSAARPGGIVAYVTCSPVLAETRDVVASLLALDQTIDQVDARDYLPSMPELGDGPDVQLWPHRHGTDAMYLALLRRGT